MSDKSGIEWTDATWNPVTGCTKVSRGCKHCYAERFAERWRGIPGHHFEQGFDLRLWPDRLEIPLRWTRPRRIFVNSMSDLFHEGIPDSFVDQVFGVMGLTARHTYQVLTKRDDRMEAYLSDPQTPSRILRAVDAFWRQRTGQSYVTDFKVGAWPLRNLWMGVSVEDQEQAASRIPQLLRSPAAVRWLSCEPLLGSVHIGRRIRELDWVVVGGESGPEARPMERSWARDLRDECRDAEVPFFFKQWGGTSSKSGGRVLDGRTWDQYPALPA